MFHMFFLARYCKLLEENSFRGRTADFFYMLLFGATVLTGIVLIGGMIPYLSESFAKIIFLSNSLTFMMVRYLSLLDCDGFVSKARYVIIVFLNIVMNSYFTGLCVEQAKSFHPYEFLGPLHFHSSLPTVGQLNVCLIYIVNPLPLRNY